MECLGPSTRLHRDWFDEKQAEILDFIGKKSPAHQAHLRDPEYYQEDALRNTHSTVQLKLCEMLGSWLSTRANDIQGYANKNDMKNLQ